MSELEDRFEALKRRFAARCVEDLPVIERALADPKAVSAEDLRFVVHRLSGAAGTFGFAELSAAAGEADDLLVADKSVPPDVLGRVVELTGAVVRACG
ncbi:Hpt domain-containing protein [Caulobacter sp. 17J80-11]|uniref:Hpt domain-containing protein n=1 Tax=Caulobacter sp. 17J80-11 TaxID=2763502 RepID=UPI001653C267|nr:Hpt domain-containing protein [Caulobacter sp. 17J80-11]